MLQITDLQAKLVENDKQILKGINLTINPGEVHVLQGHNGSGKSTLAAVLSGHHNFEVTNGKIELIDESYPNHLLTKLNVENGESILVNDLETDQRSLAGIFLAHQYPLAIPGVNLSNFLRLSYNVRQETDLPVFKFRKLLKERAELISYPEHLLDRNLNEGFSGGEKKKTEILQMALLEPRYAILDETDSGLDQKAIKDVFTGLNKLREHLPNLSLLIITHYEKVFEYIHPQMVHTMEQGLIVSSEKWQR